MRLFLFLLGAEKLTQLLLYKLFEHPQGSGTSRQNFRDVPGSFLRNPRKTNFRGKARTFRTPPPCVGDPAPSDLRTQKVNLYALLSSEIPQKERVPGSEIATRNGTSLAAFHGALKSQCKASEIASDFWGLRWASQSQIAKIAVISVR